MEITELFEFIQQNNGSDLHLVSGQEPMIRINGELRAIKTDSIEKESVRNMIHSVMTEGQRKEYEKEQEIDFAIEFGESARFRVNAFTTMTGAAAVFRTIPNKIPTLEELSSPEIFTKFAGLDKGLVLVTGPTGSGKSTTLAAMVNVINETSAKHILTIEDPVEFVHKSKKSLINHREIGSSTKSFARALKSALREDPDVILVGEMRDYETISLALTAAETGHLVLGTLHTTSAAGTVNRIIDVFPAGDKEMVRSMLASSLQAVIAQTLLPKTDGKGRCAAYEIMVGTDAIKNLIRENKIPQMFSMMQIGHRFGMQTMEDSVNALISKGLIDPIHAQQFNKKTEEKAHVSAEPTSFSKAKTLL